MKRLERVCNVLAGAVLAAMLVPASLMALPYLMNCHTFTIITGSMEPALPVGSFVVIWRGVTPEAVAVGDVISYLWDEQTLVLHRVVEKHDDGAYFITKGDANAGPDAEPVAYGQLRGRLALCIPGFGRFTGRIRTMARPLLGGSLALLAALLFLPGALRKPARK